MNTGIKFVPVVLSVFVKDDRKPNAPQPRGNAEINKIYLFNKHVQFSKPNRFNIVLK